MSMRPKTRQRLTILLVIFIVVAGAVVAGFRVRARQIGIQLEEKRSKGLAAYQARDWNTAINLLSSYYDADPSVKGTPYNEALLALAQATDYEAVRDPSQRNTAIDRWQRYLAVVPDNIEAEHSLLKLEQQTGRQDEALELSRQLLLGNPNDASALETQAYCLYQAGNAGKALDPQTHYTQLKPLDLAGWDLKFRIERQLNRPFKRMTDAVQAEEAKSSDPRLKLAEVMAYEIGYDPSTDPDGAPQLADKEKKLLMQLTSPPVEPPDATYVNVAVNLLDSFGLYSNSEQFLRRAAAAIQDPQIRGEYVHRLWENGENAEVVKELADVTPASTDADAGLVACKALALHALQKEPDADALVDALAARKDDNAAQAWALGLRANFRPDSGDTGQQFRDYETATATDPRNGVLHLMLAQAYYSAHENVRAMEEASRAVALLPSWRRARLLYVQAQGNSNDAGTEPEFAVEPRLTGEAPVADDWLVTQYYWRFATAVYHNDRAAMLDLVTGMEGFRKDHSGDAVLEKLYVVGLAELGQEDKARQVIRQTLANPPPAEDDALSQRGGQALLLALAEGSEETALGMEDQILTVAEQKFGLTPRLAFSRARYEVRAHKQTIAQAIAYLKTAAASGTGPDWQWGLTEAQFLDLCQDAGARDAWVALGNAFPKNLSVQNAILNINIAPSVWKKAGQDPAFINSTIDRLHDLTGDQALAWRLAKARVLLASGQKQDAAQASLLLTDLLKHTAVETREYQPHLLQSKALDVLGNSEGAVSEIKRAVSLAPNIPQVAYDAVLLCHEAKHYADARDAFDHLSTLGAAMPEPMAEDAARMMVDENELARAEPVLAYCAAGDNAPHSAIGLLAMVYDRTDRVKDAGDLYLKLKDATDLTPEIIQSAANFFAAYGQMATAREYLDKLDGTPLTAGQKEARLAFFEERFGDAAKADAMYRQSIDDDKADPQPVALYVGYLIRENRLPDAAQTADAGLASRPGDGRLSALKMLATALASAPYADQLAPVAISMTDDPGNPAVGATLAALADAQTIDDAAAVDRLQKAMKDNDAYYPIHELTVGRMLSSHDPNVRSAAINLAQRTMDQFSGTSDGASAAKLAANAYAANHDWTSALRAAQQWRLQAARQPEEADFYIAKFEINLGDPASAGGRLQPYLADALKKPDDKGNFNLIELYANTLLLTGQVDAADALLRPLATSGAEAARWQDIWVDAAVVSFISGDDAAAWIGRIAPLMTGADAKQKFALANAWYNMGNRFSYARGFDQCRQILKPLADGNELDATSMLILAAAEYKLNDPDAQAVFQKIVDAGAGQETYETANAQNDLANLLLARGDPASLSAAQQLASAAVTATDPALQETLPDFYDTLGHIYLKEGNAAQAIVEFRKADDLLPNNPGIMIGLADALVQGNKMDRAMQTVQLLDQRLDRSTRLTPEYQQELDSVRAALKRSTRPSVTNVETGR